MAPRWSRIVSGVKLRRLQNGIAVPTVRVQCKRSTPSNCFDFAIYSSCSGFCGGERGLGGQRGHVPPIIEKRPCIYHFLPNILVCPSNIFDKSTPLIRL